MLVSRPSSVGSYSVEDCAAKVSGANNGIAKKNCENKVLTGPVNRPLSSRSKCCSFVRFPSSDGIYATIRELKAHQKETAKRKSTKKISDDLLLLEACFPLSTSQ